MAEDEPLASVLAEFARTMLTDFPIQTILDRLVERIVDVLPVAAAGVTLISSGAKPVYIAASDAVALRFEGLQSELGDGPCLEAFSTGMAVAVPDLGAETRFGPFTSRASEAGLVAVFAFPLRHDDRQLGALDLYCLQPGPLAPTVMSAAQTLADVAAAYILNARARDELHAAVAHARALSRRDELTGLANRSAVVDDLGRALRRVRRPDHPVAVLFADLDRFKQVNDTHGHRTGDELLVAVAGRLAGVLRPGDTLGRPSGDEFVIVCDDLETRADAIAVGRRVIAALSEPFALSTVVVSTTASVGLAFATGGDHDPEDLLHAADMAMYEVKRQGGADHRMLCVDHRTPNGPTVERATTEDEGGWTGRRPAAADGRDHRRVAAGRYPGVGMITARP